MTDIVKMEAQILEKLKYRDIKPTAMRILVLKILLTQECAISLNDLEAQFEHADRITLYRTLKTFEKHRLIHRIDDGTGIVKYALCDDRCDCNPEQQHTHFYCMYCQKTYCLVDYHVPNIPLPVRFEMQEVNIVIRGTCENCTANKRNNKEE